MRMLSLGLVMFVDRLNWWLFFYHPRVRALALFSWDRETVALCVQTPASCATETRACLRHGSLLMGLCTAEACSACVCLFPDTEQVDQQRSTQSAPAGSCKSAAR